MGQSVPAIAYGVRMDGHLQEQVYDRLRHEDGAWRGFDDEHMYAGPNADDPMMGRFDVLGFVVAIAADNCEHHGARVLRPLPALPADALEAEIGPGTMAEARRKWTKLLAIARTQGVDLPQPGLIFCTVETA